MIFFGKRYYCSLCNTYAPVSRMMYHAESVGMCEKCYKKAHRFSDNCFEGPGDIKAVFSEFLYDGAIKESVKSFKFFGQRQYGVLFGRILSERLCENAVLKGCDMIVPVPLHPNRQMERGYNQAEILAEEISDIMKIPMENDVLFRIKDTKRQSTLKGLARIENVRDAFYAHPESVRDKKIILVDDICTMGETLKACESALKIAGVKEVYAITLCMAFGEN